MSLQSGSFLLQINFNSLLPLGGTFGNQTISEFLGGGSTGVQVSLSPGAGANQFQNLHMDGHSVTSGTPLLLNLTSGALLMPDKTATNFADLGLFVVRNNGTANLTVGAGSNAVTSILGASGTIIIAPGETKTIAANFAATGFAVTASTACILQFVSASGTVAFDLILTGH